MTIREGMNYIIKTQTLNPVLDNGKILHIFNNTQKDVEGYVGIINDNLIVGFKGTDSFEDILTDIKLWKKKVPYNNTKSKIRVHTGFIDAYIFDAREIIHKIIKENNPKKAFITGHSMGGAIAELCSVDVQYNFPEIEITCITAGCPRVGNRAFAESYNKRVPETYRIVNGNDPVPNLPPWWLFYKQVGNKIKIGKWHWWMFWGNFKIHNVLEYEKEMLNV